MRRIFQLFSKQDNTPPNRDRANAINRDDENQALPLFVIVGDNGVGKKMLISKLTGAPADTNFEKPCIAATENAGQIRIAVTREAQMKDVLGRKNMLNADGLIIVFDITNPKALEGAQNYIEDSGRYAKGGQKILLVANKTDLAGNRKVSEDEINNFVDKNNCAYLATNLNDKTNVHKAISQFVENVKSSKESDYQPLTPRS